MKFVQEKGRAGGQKYAERAMEVVVGRLAQEGPLIEKSSIYKGFVRISEALDSANTDPIRISTYPVTYPPICTP
jgi:hypothetical protein